MAAAPSEDSDGTGRDLRWLVVANHGVANRKARDYSVGAPNVRTACVGCKQWITSGAIVQMAPGRTVRIRAVGARGTFVRGYAYSARVWHNSTTEDGPA